MLILSRLRVDIFNTLLIAVIIFLILKIEKQITYDNLKTIRSLKFYNLKLIVVFFFDMIHSLHILNFILL